MESTQKFEDYLALQSQATVNKQLEKFHRMRDVQYEKETKVNAPQEKAQIQYSNISRQKVSESNIPLDLIFNENIDNIKRFEKKTGKNHAPITLSHWDNFATHNDPKAIVKVKCDEYSYNKCYTYDKTQSRLYLTQQERNKLQDLLREHLKKPRREANAPDVEDERERDNDDFKRFTGTETKDEIRQIFKKECKMLPKEYFELIKQSRIFDNTQKKGEKMIRSIQSTMINKIKEQMQNMRYPNDQSVGIPSEKLI